MAKDPKRPIHVGLATNLGAGTSFSLMQTMNEAYKTERLGSLQVGVVLDPKATPLLAFREARARSLEDILFVLMTLGDDRAARASYVAGALAHTREPVDA